MERNKIFCVPALNLPQNMPTKKAIKSDVQYLPEMWELEYAGYEYLDSHSDAFLYERHKALTKNMMALTSPDRDIGVYPDLSTKFSIFFNNLTFPHF